MKLKYQINLVSVSILIIVSLSITLAGVVSLDGATQELNRKLLASESKNIMTTVRAAYQVLSDNRVDKIASYVQRAQSDLLQDFRGYAFGKTGRLTIIETHQRQDLLADGKTEGTIDESCINQMEERQTGFLSCSTKSSTRLLSFDTFPEWQWLLVISVDAREVAEARNKFLGQVIVIVLASLIAGSFLFFWFSARLVRPIRQLTAAAAQVSEGKWDAPLPELKGGSEIAELSTIFQKMSKNLAGVYAKLRENIDHMAESREKLQQSQEQFKALVENSSDLIWEVDRKGHYTYVSPQISNLLGYKPEEILNKSWTELIAQPETDAAAPDLAALLQKKTSFSAVERLLHHKDGQPVILESSGAPFIDANGEFCGFRGIDRDITERKKAVKRQQQLQTQLIQAQKMESIGRLAGGVAHDFNNMLSVILGNTDLAMDEVSPTSELSSFLKEIQKAAERSAEITRQLLAFARKQPVAPRQINLNEAIQRLLKMLRRLIGEAIKLDWQPSPDIWPIKLDASQLDQILINLCINSRDAIADTGKISIATRNTQLNSLFCKNHPELAPGDYAVLEIADTGCGMSKEVQSHLFEPFFTTKELGKGTGLGLAMVYGIVHQNRGIIETFSTEGKGTTFRIFFPRSQPKIELSPEKTEKGREIATKGTILLVEDEAMVLKLTEKMLTRVGYTILHALNPAEAIALAHQHQGNLDLLITDVVMPEMNGLEMMKQIIAICPEVKCLFMSGYPADVIAHHGALDQGVNFIQKPFTREAFIEKLNTIIGR